MINRTYDMNVSEIEHLHSGDGVIVKKDIIKDQLPSNIKMYAKLTINQGCSIGFHKHENDCEVFYILRGIAEYFDGTTKSKLSVGDSAFCEKGGSHSISNASVEPLELLASIIK